jgi:hypothetical protein
LALKISGKSGSVSIAVGIRAFILAFKTKKQGAGGILGYYVFAMLQGSRYGPPSEIGV